MTPEQKAASRVGMRQYARGRAYDPERFGGVTPYYEEPAAGPVAPEEKPDPTKTEIPAEVKPLDTELEEINAELDAAIEETPADESKED